MRFSSRSRTSIVLSLSAIFSMVAGLLVVAGFFSPAPAHAASSHMSINCADQLQSFRCAEVQDSEQVFGEGVYVGHDEPSNLFYSNTPGAGNRVRWQMTLPSDPPPAPTAGKSFNFQLHPAFWFGMAMCDTQSFPEQISTCTPDSDTNIVDPAVSSQHAGVAFTEMQFYPPGWVSWPGGNTSCDATKWCAALNIDSLSQNPVTGQVQNATCQAIAGLEYVNFAFITKDGVAQAPANPVESTAATFTPDPQKDLFMNSGDHIVVQMSDTPQGLRVDIIDATTGQSGSMTASGSNSFGQVRFDPTGTSCQNIPYDFHPMYSTSSEQTRVTWAAHSYNIAFSDEIGHFQSCDVVTAGRCTGSEGTGAADGDDVGCHAASESLLVQVAGCTGQNNGFDGLSYHPVWPDGSNMHPTAVRFTSPLTGLTFNTNYERSAIEVDLPRIEANTCNRATGVGCTLFPTTDAGTPAPFYPYFSYTNATGAASANWENHTCTWGLGSSIPGSTSDLGKNNQYGPLLSLAYTSGSGTVHRFNDFRQVFNSNPCPAATF